MILRMRLNMLIWLLSKLTYFIVSCNGCGKCELGLYKTIKWPLIAKRAYYKAASHLNLLKAAYQINLFIIIEHQIMFDMKMAERSYDYKCGNMRPWNSIDEHSWDSVVIQTAFVRHIPNRCEFWAHRDDDNEKAYQALSFFLSLYSAVEQYSMKINWIKWHKIILNFDRMTITRW